MELRLALARLCDDAGLFHAAGVAMARATSGSQNRLLASVFAVAAVVTAILSLDATVVLLTPVVLATARTVAVPAGPHATPPPIWPTARPCCCRCPT